MGDTMSKISIDELSSFAKKKGFVFPSTEIYGGMAGFFDYGPLGVELKNNIRSCWWKTFVQNRDDVFGIDGSLISSAKVWEASGHLSSFADMLTECSKCKKNHRADHLIEDKLKINVEGMDSDELNKIIKNNGLKCPECKGELKEITSFNLMFPLNIGADRTDDSLAYLRGETAQLIFSSYKSVVDSSRVKLPFGIAQVGKAFRNEISPRNFLFRTREFDQMEIEYFIHPEEKKCKLLSDDHKKLKFQFLSKEAQKTGKNQESVLLGDLLKKKVLGEWHAYWLAESYLWYVDNGIDPKNLRIREHTPDELSFYSKGTFDIDYNFPFGWKEIHGNANRSQHDLSQHQKFSGKSMEIFDEETKMKVLPRVIEPSFGLDRAFLSFIYDAYNYDPEDKERNWVVLKFHPRIAPIKIAVFPLHNKLEDAALKLYLTLKNDFVSTWDRSGAIGRRYARADEQGIPFTITFDFESLEDNSVTIRDRDTTKQVRVKIPELKSRIHALLEGSENI